MVRRSCLLALFVLPMAAFALLMAVLPRPVAAGAATPTPDVRSWPPDLTPYVRPIVPGDLPLASPGPTPTPTRTRPPGARIGSLTPTPDVRSWPPDLTPYVRPVVPGDRATGSRHAPGACVYRRAGALRPTGR
jgi:hypothetical protein